MVRLARIAGVVAALLGGVLAGRVLWSPLPDDYVRTESALPAVLVANGAAVACAAVVGLLVTVALTRRRSMALVASVAVAGLLLLALPELVQYPGEPAALLYSNAVAAGLVLGGVSPLAARDASSQGALAVGALGAFLLSGAVVDLRRFGAGDTGWAAYTALSEAEPTGVVGLWPAVVAAAIVVVAAFADRRPSWSARVDTRWLAVALALPVGAFVANWVLMESGAQPQWWYPYVGLTVALVAWIAWRLPGADGRVIFAGTAVLAAATGGVPATPTNWWTLAIPSALIVAGVVVGIRWPVPAVGFVLLAATAAASVANPDQWDVPAIAYLLVLPAAAGYVIGACLPTSAPAATVGLSLPFTVGIPGAAAAAWTIGERYLDHASVFEEQATVSVPAAVVAVAVVVVCGVGAWGLDLRSGAR
ncbi:hypothetical protein EGT67_18110 [Prescottella agglutinans]|uniref:Uncharacterized protein n=1 Tax=Prescottella agglutinans TaxID=1644129 RepID=A0A3S3E9C9_9NOCA|nr:hypothetical protein [Prescottella agglutinans]RVW08311.1 hypothetical protein EGT67_18110 [Prescottella agglutinans]